MRGMLIGGTYVQLYSNFSYDELSTYTVANLLTFAPSSEPMGGGGGEGRGEGEGKITCTVILYDVMQSRSTSLSMGEYLQTVLNSILHEKTVTVQHYSMPVREYPRAWPCSFTKTLQHACTRVPTCVAMQLYQDTTACLYASTHVRGHAASPRHSQTCLLHSNVRSQSSDWTPLSPTQQTCCCSAIDRVQNVYCGITCTIL